MTRLDRRVIALERQWGVGVPCDCALRVVVLYADGDVECFNPRQPGQTLDPASDRCPHGRPWQGEKLYDLRGANNRAADVEAGGRV
jgi:hypothetical protein